MPQMIKEPTLRELARANSLSGAIAVGQRGGYAITVKYGMGEAQRLLANARGETRVFSNLNTLANFLQRIGISQFKVDSSRYERARIRARRPDRAAAMKRTRTRPQQTTLELGEGAP
jgi:hypothetical protein